MAISDESAHINKLNAAEPERAGIVISRRKRKTLIKVSSVYVFYVLVAWIFDYLYIPWLGIRYQYFAIIPLFLSLFLVSIFGLILVKFSKEDVLLVGKINRWLSRESSAKFIYSLRARLQAHAKLQLIETLGFWRVLIFGFEKLALYTNAFKKKIQKHPKLKFITISVWSGPLHAFLFFEHELGSGVRTVLKTFAIGSIYCAVFWGLIIDVAVLVWHTLEKLL
jgi:hypothetical protein